MGSPPHRARSSPVHVRRAERADNEILARIGAETFFDAFADTNTPEDMDLYLKSSFSPEIQARELAEPGSLFLIAEVDREPVGYARLREGDPPEAITGERPVEIVRLYVRSQWIGRNVGATLMRHCLEEAEARRCDTVWLDVWEENDRALLFYEKWGFEVVGAQPFRLGNDVQPDLLMQRPVRLDAQG